MPLSNWDALAFDENGECCLAELGHPNGSRVYLEKNQLVLENDELAMLLRMDVGSFFFEDLIVIVDGSTTADAVFFLTAYYDEDTPEDDDADLEEPEDSGYGRELRFRIISGIGCAGYRSNLTELLARKQIEISPEQWHRVKMEHRYNKSGGQYVITYPDANGKLRKLRARMTEETLKNDIDYIGITPEVYEEYLEWASATVETLAEFLDDDDEIEFYREWLEAVEGEVPLRYNQGDAFLLEAEELANVPATRIGNAKSPTLDFLLKLPPKKD
jgi:hypothetical protein